MVPSDQKTNRIGRPGSGFAWRIALVVFLIASVSCRLSNVEIPAVQSVPGTTPALPTALPQAVVEPTPTATQAPLPPALSEVWPAPGSVVSPAGGFAITFSEPMDRDSVEAALQFQPPASGSLSWESDTLLRVYPDPAAQPDSRFSVRISDEASAANGLDLLAPLELDYKTPEELKLIDRFPGAQAVAVNPAAPVAVTFNQPVVPLSGEGTAQQPAFSLSPAAAGVGEWRNTSTYVFYPDPPLAGGTAYTLTLAADLESLAGMPLSLEGESGVWQFTTALPEVVSVSPDNTDLIFLDDLFSVTFNQPMDAESVAQNFTLQDEKGSRIEGTITWDKNDTVLQFNPAALLERSTSYTLILPQEARSKGGAPLGNAYLRDYQTISFLNPVVTNPPSGKPLNVSGGFASLTLTFNAPLDNQEPGSLISITPQVDNLSVFVDSSRQNVFISGYFEPSMEYQLRLSPDIRDRWGVPLGREIIFPVATSPAHPSLTIPMLLVGSPTLFLTTADKDFPVQATNLAAVELAYTPISLEDFVYNAGTYSLSEPLIAGPDWVNWTLPLELTPNRQESVNLGLTPEGQPLEAGLYYFRLSPQASEGDQPFEVNFLAVVSPVQLSVKRSADQIVVWAVDLSDLTPVEGQEVRLMDYEGVLSGSGVTDEDGVCVISIPSGTETFREYFAVMGEPGAPDFALTSTLWNNRVSGWSFGIPTFLTPAKPFAYIYSDRPIYRPGHTLYFRAVLRNADNGRYALPDLEQINVKLLGPYNARIGEQLPISRLTLPVSEYGTVEGSIELPENSPPGTYTLLVEEIAEAALLIQVEEYRRPETEVEIAFSKADYLPDEEIRAEVNARYYFGEAAAGVKINWALYARDEYFSIPGGYTTGKQNAVWLTPYWWTGFDPVLGTYIVEGSGTTDENGALEIHLPVSELERLDVEQHQLLTLEASIQAEGEYPLSSRATTLLHPAGFYIGVRPESWTGQAGKELGYNVRTVDWLGKPSGGHVLRAELQKITWEAVETESWNPNGPSQDPVYALVSSTDFATDSEGRARLAFTPPEPGSYQIEIVGEGATTQLYVWVSGESGAAWPNLPDQHIQLETEQEDYQPGDTARVFFPNPFAESALALVSIERSRVMRTEVITLTEPSHILEIPLSAEDAPNVFVSVTLLGKLPDGTPDFRQGYRELRVAAAEQKLQISLIPEKTEVQPGEAVDFTLAVRDASGNPVVGEFSLAVVDKATLALAGGLSAGITDAFYGSQSLGVLNSLSLASYARRIALLPPGLGGGGSGYMMPTIREDFPDTAYWNGKIETGEDGTAQVNITLPDNLTTWVADLRGLTRDTKVGEATQEVVVSKELLIRPQTPRFLVAGDRTRVAVVVHNNTDNDVRARVSLQAKGLVFEDESTIVQQIELPANGQAPVYWWGVVQDVAAVELIFNARAGDLNDSTRPAQGEIPVYVYSAPVTYGTSGLLDEAGERLEVVAMPQSYTPTGGSLDVELSTSLSASILQDLEALKSTPTNHTQAILSKLLSNLAAARMLRNLSADAPLKLRQLEEEILKDVDQVVASQDELGGWGWSVEWPGNPYITAYALLNLHLADEAGYLVDDNLQRKAQEYLAASLFRPTEGFETWQLDRLAFQHFILQRSGQTGLAPNALYDYRARMNPWAKAFLALTFYEMDPGDTRASILLDDLKSSALLSATGTHWEDDYNSFANGSTANFSTAVVVYALSRMDPDSPLVMDAARYLVYHRKASGGWNSSYETAWVLLALTEALQRRGDLQAEFDYAAMLNENPVIQKAGASGQYAAADLASIPVSELNSSGANTLRVSRGEGEGTLYYRAFLELHQQVDSVEPLNRGITITRSYYPDDPQCLSGKCEALDEIALSKYEGAVLVRVSVTMAEESAYLVVEDFIPAGTEIINPALETNLLGSGAAYESVSPDGYESNWGSWFFAKPQIYDNRILWSAERLPTGTFELSYRLSPVQAGEYRVLPARAYLSYYPDVEGRSGGMIFNILP